MHTVLGTDVDSGPQKARPAPLIEVVAVYNPSAFAIISLVRPKIVGCCARAPG
jgi:hypothetical protein